MSSRGDSRGAGRVGALVASSPVMNALANLRIVTCSPASHTFDGLSRSVRTSELRVRWLLDAAIARLALVAAAPSFPKLKEQV